MKNPLVSIIVPCYNQAQYLDEALQSVIDQTYQNWECIIVNDGSPDNAEFVVKQWLAKDSRFVYLYKENGGLSSARNAGLDNANGDYIQFLDADDLLNPNKFYESIEEINLLKSYDNTIIITNYKMFKKDIYDKGMYYSTIKNEYLNLKSLLYKWDIEFTIPIHCALFSSNLFRNLRFSEELKAKEDWLMWISVFSKKPFIFFINEILVYYRLHENSMSQSNSLMKENIIEFCAIIKKHIDVVEYELFLIHMIKCNLILKNEIQDIKLICNKLTYELNEIKKSNTYKFSLKLKKWLNSLFTN
jgi:glycosyltransferase involved in cell wall biosynthesis